MPERFTPDVDPEQLATDPNSYLRACYNAVWENVIAYRRFSPELKLLRHLDIANWKPTLLPKALSLGCGIGQGFRHMMQAGFDAYGCDIADSLAKWYDDCPERFQAASAASLPYSAEEFNISVCVDVLEHLPEAMVAEGLRELLRVTKNVFILGVCCVPSQLVKDLHLTVMPPSWWLRKFEQLGTIKLINGNSINLAVVVEKEAPSVVTPSRRIYVPGERSGS
jgi:SAM-dependent methyltransferase